MNVTNNINVTNDIYVINVTNDITVINVTNDVNEINVTNNVNEINVFIKSNRIYLETWIKKHNKTNLWFIYFKGPWILLK